jgi:glutathione S-transferase
VAVPIVYGVQASPYVRKVRVALAEKNVAYEIDPVIPARAPEGYRAISPLGKIPAFRHGDFTISDSSVICAYVERVWPQPPLYPADAKEYARALWLEEYADTELAAVLTGKLFFQRVVRPILAGQPSDETAVAQAIATDLPPLLDYVESQAASRTFLAGGTFSIADIAVASQLANAALAGVSVDAARWPATARLAERIFERPSFRACLEEERATLPPS